MSSSLQCGGGVQICLHKVSKAPIGAQRRSQNLTIHKTKRRDPPFKLSEEYDDDATPQHFRV